MHAAAHWRCRAATADNRSQPIISRQSAERNVSIIYPPISVSILLFSSSHFGLMLQRSFFVRTSTRIPAIQCLFRFYNFTSTRKNVNFRFLFAENGARVVLQRALHWRLSSLFYVRIICIRLAFWARHMRQNVTGTENKRDKSQIHNQLQPKYFISISNRCFSGADARIKWTEWMKVEWDLKWWAGACDCHINLFAIESIAKKRIIREFNKHDCGSANSHRLCVTQCYCHIRCGGQRSKEYSFFPPVAVTQLMDHSVDAFQLCTATSIKNHTNKF